MFDTKEFLSKVIIYSKYAKYSSAMGRRENWTELVMRNAEMHAERYPEIADEIYTVYARSVLTKKVVPSMRSFQFAGRAIEVNHSRMFNCASRKLDSATAFAEVMFLLLGGSGVGISVQKQHVSEIPPLRIPRKTRRKFVVSDDIMGWADAVKALMKSYLNGLSYVDFDYSDIRPKGTRLVTAGGHAPGPEPLRECVAHIRTVLDRAIEDRGEWTQITSIEAHDIACHIANAVLAGGIRRSAMISLFSHDDEDMLVSKGNFPIDIKDVVKLPNGMFDVVIDYKGRNKSLVLSQWDIDNIRENGTLPWYHLEEQRGRANNSVMLLRSETGEEQFRNLMKKVEASKAGEPGVYWTNDLELGTNPCCEISLDLRGGFCNLTEANVSELESEEDFLQRIKDATFLGTLQAGYTEFHYLGEQWREIAEEDALLGVSMTGIGSGQVLQYDITKAAEEAKAENIRVAGLIGLNPAKRIGTVKPSGTASLVLGCSSGIHAWHNEHYIRRVRVNKDEALYQYALDKLGSNFVEDDAIAPHSTGVLSIPIKAPAGSILRTESPIDLMERVKRIQMDWIRATHIDGKNAHNVSVTVSVLPNQWDEVTQWMWDNRDIYNGISLLDYDGGTYPQMPFEDCSEDHYLLLSKSLEDKAETFVIEDILEEEDNTNHSGEAACSGGSCEVSAL